MKKTILILLTLCLTLTLAACGGGSAASATPAAATPAPPAAPTPEPTATPTPESAETEAVEAEPSDFEKAKALIDKDVEELYAAIGQPLDSEYAPSCLGGIDDGSEDGRLFYDGFFVETFRKDGREEVRLVIAD